jgi:CRP-like cAMP-binding protein
MTASEFESLLLKLMSSIVLFRDLEREDLVDLLRGASKAVFKPGEIVFEAGYSGHSMYVVVQGRFEVFKTVEGEEAHIATVGPGEHFGEIALVTDRPRMASVRASEESVALRLTKAAVFAQPKVAVFLLKNMAGLMAGHLQEMNDEVLFLDLSRRSPRQAAGKPVTPRPRVQGYRRQNG